MSNSVYRSYEIRVKAQDKVVIDSRQRAEELIQANLEKEKRREEERRNRASAREEQENGSFEGEEGFVEGIPGLQELVTDPEAGEAGAEGYEDVDPGIDDASAAAALEAASEEAERIVSEAREEAQRILDEAGNEAEEIRSNAFQEGRESGYNEGQEAFAEESERLKQEYQDRLSEMEAEYDRKLREAEPKMAEVITSVYERVFSCDLTDHSQILLQLLRTALRDSESSRNFIIHVSEEDREAVSENRDSLREAAGEGSSVDIIMDVTLSRGQALIENDDGIIDCGIDTELKELTARLKILAGT